MVTTGQAYLRKVYNRSGYILQLPGVATMAELIQGDIDPYAQSITQLFPLGTKLTQGDRTWRYCKNGAGTLAAGMILDAPLTLHGDANQDLVTGTTVAGATSVTMTGTANTVCAANYFKEGYLTVGAGAGAGYSYKIKSHAACTGAATFAVELYDPIVIATAVGTSQSGLRKNPYDMVIVSTAGASVPVGVSTGVVTAAYYFWAQTGGPCAVNSKTVIALSTRVVSGVTAGQADDDTPVTTVVTVSIVIGYPITAAVVDGEFFLCMLTLDR